jgi:hypothetical protein
MKISRIFAALLLSSVFLISCTKTSTDEELQLLQDHKELTLAGPGDNNPPPPPPPDPD